MRLQVESTTHCSTPGSSRMLFPAFWSLWGGTENRSLISTGAVR